jgi:pseudouridine-5'-phosphate glycosidase
MDSFVPSSEISRAMKLALPMVALESTVITHGLPHPQNLSLARDMEAAVRDEGAIPATIAIIGGQVRVGLSDSEIEDLSKTTAMKVSRRDVAAAVFKKADGGTTVAGTMFIAQRAGIRIFATGGIGGVHREARFDVSADLQALADTPMIVVCAGAKAILDLPATLEYLETMSVPVVGYQTSDFPAFYSPESGLNVTIQLDTPEEIVGFAQAHWAAGLHSAVLVTNPIPAAYAISRAEMEPIIARASEEAVRQKTRGQALTPFLLQRIKELTGGKSLNANLGLLLNNAHLAGNIARVLATRQRTRQI